VCSSREDELEAGLLGLIAHQAARVAGSSVNHDFAHTELLSGNRPWIGSMEKGV
jgi:hypothetical protein